MQICALVNVISPFPLPATDRNVAIIPYHLLFRQDNLPFFCKSSRFYPVEQLIFTLFPNIITGAHGGEYNIISTLKGGCAESFSAISDEHSNIQYPRRSASNTGAKPAGGTAARRREYSGGPAAQPRRGRPSGAAAGRREFPRGPIAQSRRRRSGGRRCPDAPRCLAGLHTLPSGFCMRLTVMPPFASMFRTPVWSGC